MGVCIISITNARCIISIIRKPADVVRDVAEDPIPDWAVQQNQHDEERAEHSRDPYDHGGRSAGSERGQKGSANAIIENKFIKVTKKEIPESIKIGYASPPVECWI